MEETIDIQIPDIEKELNRMPQEGAKNQKACLFTLIIYASESRRAQYLQALVETILDKFPCRIIFIQEDEKADREHFHVKVSNVTSGGGGPKSNSEIACDQIIISASKKQLFRAPFIVIPHIVQDLPVYLMWGQNPFEEKELFPHLHPFASRVVFDSECSDDLKLFCEEMQTNLEVLNMDIMDINWALISNWRDMLAYLFNSPEKCSQLKSLKSITITYNQTKTDILQHPEIRAIYLQGWFASRLKWRYRQIEKFENNFLISYYSEQNPVVIALSPRNYPDLPSGALSSLELTTTEGQSYWITRKSALSQVEVYASTIDKCELPFSLPLPTIHRGLNFIREIFYRNLGTHYRDMLKEISQHDYKIINN